jgi:large subunit ribosomal protein L10
VAVINPRGINANKNHGIRRRLREKGLRMTVVRNTLARRAVEGGRLQGFDRLLDGPSAVIYGEASIAQIARQLLDEKKADEKLELRGVFFDGETYVGDAGVETVSKLPTREEAIANVLSAISAPGRKLAAAIKGPGGHAGRGAQEHRDQGQGPRRRPAPEAAAPRPPPPGGRGARRAAAPTPLPRRRLNVRQVCDTTSRVANAPAAFTTNLVRLPRLSPTWG